jgi:hypothetical protein
MPHFFSCDSAGVFGRDGDGRNANGPFQVPGCWRAVALLAVVVMSCGGCNGDENDVSITGCVMLDGSRIPAEIQIEQLGNEGTRVGRATMAYADDGGQFSASIERQNDADGPLTCSLVVRVSQISRSGMPAAFDESAPRDKVVRLTRVVRHNDSMNLLLTR